MIGDNRYEPLARRAKDEMSLVLKERQEYYLVGAAALIYGSMRAFINLAANGLEREAIQHQRHVMECYFLARYYSEHPLWCFVHWTESVMEEADFLERVIDQHGSRHRLEQLREDAKSASRFLSSVPKGNRKDIRPSIEVLAKRYAREKSDYTMLYRWPSQVTHATFLGLNWGLMEDYTPRFESEVSTINRRAAVVTDYVISFMETIGPHVRTRSVANLKSFRRQLRTQCSRQKIRRSTASAKFQSQAPSRSVARLAATSDAAKPYITDAIKAL